MVIRAADQDPRLRNAHLVDQPEILRRSPDPGGDLRIPQPQLPAAVQGLPIFLAVDEKLRLPHDTLGAGEPAEELEQLHDLVRGEGLHGLLPVPEGGVGDPDLLRHPHRHPAMVEGDFGGLLIVKGVPVQHRLRHILQLILVGFLLQQMGRIREFQHGFIPPVYLYTIIQIYRRLSIANPKKSPSPSPPLLADLSRAGPGARPRGQKNPPTTAVGGDCGFISEDSFAPGSASARLDPPCGSGSWPGCDW